MEDTPPLPYLPPPFSDVRIVVDRYHCAPPPLPPTFRMLGLLWKDILVLPAPLPHFLSPPPPHHQPFRCQDCCGQILVAGPFSPGILAACVTHRSFAVQSAAAYGRACAQLVQHNCTQRGQDLASVLRLVRGAI